MEQKEGRCPNCLSILKLNPLEEASVCPYCGHAFVVAKAIQNYEKETVSANDETEETSNRLTQYLDKIKTYDNSVSFHDFREAEKEINNKISYLDSMKTALEEDYKKLTESTTDIDKLNEYKNIQDETNLALAKQYALLNKKLELTKTAIKNTHNIGELDHEIDFMKQERSGIPKDQVFHEEYYYRKPKPYDPGVLICCGVIFLVIIGLVIYYFYLKNNPIGNMTADSALQNGIIAMAGVLFIFDIILLSCHLYWSKEEVSRQRSFHTAIVRRERLMKQNREIDSALKKNIVDEREIQI